MRTPAHAAPEAFLCPLPPNSRARRLTGDVAVRTEAHLGSVRHFHEHDPDLHAADAHRVAREVVRVLFGGSGAARASPG